MSDQEPKKEFTHDQADADGNFRRKDSIFRSWVSADPKAEFPAATDRYVLYINKGCPWAHRTAIVRLLKGLEDVIQLVVMGLELSRTEGWLYDGSFDTATSDPLHGFTTHAQLYRLASPTYSGRYTVPVLWDKQRNTIVSNESADIIRMFYTAFDAFIAPELREANKPPGAGLLPDAMRGEIDALNAWVYDTVNNGVYKTGFATEQAAYEANVLPLFESLDRLEGILQRGGPFLFGEHITDADIRLYTTSIRFDVAYHTIFKCNLRMIRHDYPALHRWLRTLYWDATALTRRAFARTTHFETYRLGYAKASRAGIVPLGPVPDILPL